MSDLNTEITQKKEKERSLQTPLSYSVSHSFVLTCISQIFISEMHRCTKTYCKQQTETKHKDNYSTKY